MTSGKDSFAAAHSGITSQAVTNIFTEVENNLAESKRARNEIDEIKCKL